MAKMYVSQETINDAVAYFKEQEYNSPEQIGLFFFFKAMKFNSKEYQSYLKDQEAKKQNTRILYYLAGLFDNSTEKGGKRTGLFPFSISSRIKPSSYYNGGTEFRGLYSRVKDTMDNTLVDDGKYLRKDELDPERFKFAPDYITILFENFLNSKKISLSKFAAWYFRFYAFEVSDEWEENLTQHHFEEFTRICKKKLIEELNLTAEEISVLFEKDDEVIKYQSVPITGQELRDMLSFENGASEPEVSVETNPSDMFAFESYISAEEINDLVTPHGNNITVEKLEELLNDTRQVILAGPPGTGKTYISSQIKKKFDVDYLVQFHPNLTYEQFIGGNTFEEDGSVKAKAGIFIEFCERAKINAGKYLFLIDEINRGNVSKVFGETILALDRGYTAQLPTPLKTTDGKVVSEFSIPENVYILATMNSADRSIALVDYAIRRRFAFVNFYPNSEIVDYMSDYTSLPEVKVSKIMDNLNDKLFAVLGDTDLLLGQSYFMPKWAIDSITKKIIWNKTVLLSLFNYYILPIIEEYTYGNRRYLLNILGDQLPSRITNEEEFISEIIKQFGN